MERASQEDACLYPKFQAPETWLAKKSGERWRDPRVLPGSESFGGRARATFGVNQADRVLGLSKFRNKKIFCSENRKNLGGCEALLRWLDRINQVYVH
jgi:hypothetical protein